jgi:hypothetical protein
MLLRRARDAGLAVAAVGGKLVIHGPKRAEPVARLLIDIAALILVEPAPEAAEAASIRRGGTITSSEPSIGNSAALGRKPWPKRSPGATC